MRQRVGGGSSIAERSKVAETKKTKSGVTTLTRVKDTDSISLIATYACQKKKNVTLEWKPTLGEKFHGWKWKIFFVHLYIRERKGGRKRYLMYVYNMYF